MTATIDSYRAARKAFIAAATAKGLDTVSRVHPRRGPDGMPLFLDVVALGPRKAARAFMLTAHGLEGSLRMTDLIRDGLDQKSHTRLLLAHGLEPYVWAWGAPDPVEAFGPRMLRLVLGEDLPAVETLLLVPLDGPENLAEALARPELAVRTITPDPSMGLEQILSGL